jgi:hypothetical protein
MATDNFLLKIKGEFEDHITDALKGLTTGTVPGLITALGALAGAFAVEKLVEFTREAINVGDELDELSQKIGITVEQLSAFSLTAHIEGISNESFATAIKKLSKAMVEAGDETNKQAKIFKELGVEVADSQGKLRSAGDVMADLADVFKNSENGANKTALAMELMGKSGTDLIPMLNNGKQALADMNKQAELFGLVWSGDQAAQAAEFKDNLNLVTGAANGLWEKVAKDLLPVLLEISRSFADSVKEGGIMRDFYDGFAQILTSVVIPVIKFAADTIELLSTTMHIAAYAAAGFVATLERVANLDFSGAAEVIKSMSADIAKAVNDYEEYGKKLDNPGQGGKALEEQKNDLKGIGTILSSNTDKAEKLTDEYAKAETSLMQSLYQVNAAGKTAEVTWNTANGEYKKFNEEQKQQLISIAREIDLQTQLVEIYKLKGEWFDNLAQKQRASQDALIEAATTDPFARAGQQNADQHVAEVNKWAQAQREVVKNYEAEAKAVAEKNIADLVASETSAERLQVYKDMGEAVARSAQQLEVWNEATSKNKDTAAKLNFEVAELNRLLALGKITQEEYTNVIEKNSKAQLELWASQSSSNARFKSLILDDRKAIEDLKKSQEELNAAFSNGTISSAEYQYKLKQVGDQIRNINPTYQTDMVGKLNDQMKSAAASFEGMFSDYIFNAMQGKWENFGNMVKQIIDRMVANMLAAQLQFALFGDIGNTPSGKTSGSTGAIGGIFNSIFGGSSSGILADMFKADGGPVRAGQAYIVGENRPELFVPSSSGTIVPSVPNGNNVTFNISALDGADLMRTLSNKQREISEMVFSTGSKYNLAGAR